jgi:TonB family protein
MRDAVDSVIEAREALDHGFSGSLLMSGAVHGLLVGGAFLAAFLAPKEPLIKIAQGFTVQMAGGRGNPNPAPQAPAPPATQPAKTEPEAKPEPPPQIAKPPQPVERQGLPDPDVKKPTTKPSAKPEPPRPAPRSAAAAAAGTPVRAAGGGGTGTANEPIGLSVLPDGAGVGTGNGAGDYYIAGIQRKIWQIWLQQVKQTFPQPVVVTFTLNPDGSVPLTSVQITQTSGVAMLDLAARRAVQTAAPFSAFPKDYAIRPITIQAEFRPTY